MHGVSRYVSVCMQKRMVGSKQASERGEEPSSEEYRVQSTENLLASGALRRSTRFNPSQGLGWAAVAHRGVDFSGVEVARGTEMRGHVRKDTMMMLWRTIESTMTRSVRCKS